MEKDTEVRSVFSILDVYEGPEIGKKNSADIVIIHKDEFHRKQTLVSITDKYRKRNIEPSEDVFTLNIQKWTEENCMDFEKFGKMMAIEYWKRYLNQRRIAAEEAEEERIAEEKSQIFNRVIRTL